MIIGVLKEPEHETRVAVLPEHIAAYQKRNLSIRIEAGAGSAAWASDAAYTAAGATVSSRTDILAAADILLSIHLLTTADLAIVRPGTVLLGVFQPLYHITAMAELAAKGITVFSMDMIPRTTRAQSMDVLSSQANIAGYKAVLLAAGLLPHYFPMFMTAAGSIPPARVLILGAGVAGLQAIATAKRLGAVVEVFDTRPAVKEEVMSLGARFVEVEGAADAAAAGGYAVEQSQDFQQRQQARIAESVAKADIVITTAQIPGKKAPLLVSTAMVESMRAGSVIIDIAAATGGNTPLTQNDATIEHQGVRIVGASNLAGTLPSDASKLYGKNILNFLPLVTTAEGQLNLNFADDIVKGSCITHGGELIHDKTKSLATSQLPVGAAQ